MRLFTGTSGFAYKEWKGAFYPDDLPGDGLARHGVVEHPTPDDGAPGPAVADVGLDAEVLGRP